jgi:pimeloyl-ACP methyl ester carboxylesterase
MMIGARHPALAGRIMVVDMLPQPAGLIGGTAAEMGPLADSLKGMLDTEGGRALFGSLITSFSPPDRGNRRSDPDVVARAMRDLARIDLGDDLGRLRPPLTVVYASPNARMRVSVDRTYASAYSAKTGVRLVRIDNSGHMVMLDQPVRFRQALSEFLGRGSTSL